MPDHLRMRFEVVGPQGNVLTSGRDIESLRPFAIEKHEDRLWHEARKTWERDANSPDGISATCPRASRLEPMHRGLHGLPIRGWQMKKEGSPFVFSPSRTAHGMSTREGLMRLYRNAFAAELKDFRKDWAFPDSFGSTVFFHGRHKKGFSGSL